MNKYEFVAWKKRAKKSLKKSWYWLMTPVAYVLTSVSERTMDYAYKKIDEKLTRERAVEWLAQDLMRYVVLNQHEVVEFMICDWASEDDFWYGCHLRKKWYIKRLKSKQAFKRFEVDIKMQEDIVQHIKDTGFFEVEETVEDVGWRSVRQYQKTVVIKLKA